MTEGFDARDLAPLAGLVPAGAFSLHMGGLYVLCMLVAVAARRYPQRLQLGSGA